MKIVATRWWIFLGIAAVLLSSAITYHFYISYRSGPAFDGLMLRVFDKAAGVYAYRERAETTVVVSKRGLKIDGSYRIDLKTDTFSSDSTTTLTALGASTKPLNESFVLRNVSVGNDIYYELSTKSPSLQYIMLAGPGWHHFGRGNVPKNLVNVAISGPILDDLALFRAGPKYLDYVGKILHVGTTTRYLLKLSSIPPPARGTVESLEGHITAGGHIDLWVNSDTAEIERIHFSGPNYESTTTILSSEGSGDISAPISFK